MSNLRNLMSKIDEIDMNSKGQRGLDLQPLEGGGGGGGFGSKISPMKIDVGPDLVVGGGGGIRTGLGSAIGKGLARVWKNPRTGQTSSTPPAGVKPKPTTEPLPAGAIAKPAQQPLPAGVQPSTAGAGRGTVNPQQAPKDTLGKERPGGQVDSMGRREPGTGKAYDPKEFRPPEEKVTKKDLAKSVAGHAALVGAGLLGNKNSPGQEGGGTPSTQTSEPIMVEPVAPNNKVTEPADSASTQTNRTSSQIDLPTVGPQGPTSPFVVVGPDTEPEIAATPAPALTTKPNRAKASAPSASGTGAGADSGKGSQTSPATGTGSFTGNTSGTSMPAVSTPYDSSDPFPQLRHQLKRTNEHRSVNKLIKEFKRFVNRKV